MVETDSQKLAVLAENFLAQQLIAFADQEMAKLSYLRSANGEREIDFILEMPEGIIPIEVKASEKVSVSDARHIVWFASQTTKFQFGMVVYLGKEQFQLAENVFAVPMAALWQ